MLGGSFAAFCNHVEEEVLARAGNDFLFLVRNLGGGKSVVAFQKLRVPVVLDPEEHAVHGLFGSGSNAGIAQLPSIRAAGMLDASQASVISESA